MDGIIERIPFRFPELAPTTNQEAEVITITFHRYNGEDHEWSQTRDSLSALELLVNSELAFGGKVVQAEPPTKMVVRTYVLGCIDTTTFTGTEDEMRCLFEAVHYFSLAVSNHSETTREQVARQLIKLTGGKPLLVTALAPLLIGKHRLKVAILLACGITDPDDLRVGTDLPKEDLIAAIGLRLENPEISFREIIDAVSV